MKKSKLSGKKRFWLSMGITIGLIIIFSISYALWQLYFTQTGSNRLIGGCFETELIDEGLGINLDNSYPITEIEAMEMIPYTIKIKNTCDIASNYDVRIETLPSTNLEIQYVRSKVDNRTSDTLNVYQTATPVITNATDAYVIYTGYLDGGDEIIHNIRIWMDYETTTEQGANKLFEAKVSIQTSATVEKRFLRKEILAQGGGALTIEAKGDPAMDVVPTAETSGLYATQDEYGTSYYYRGEKDSLANNVIFAEHQWKVVRINGDGSIRLIYNGVCPNNSCTINSEGPETAINNGTTYMWNTTYYNDAKYVGYMYGGLNGEVSTSKDQAQTNTTNSNAKTVLDSWYESNIKDTEYEEYIADNIFCNDRSITSGPGYETSETIYNANTRIFTNTSNPTPTLLCEQQNDRFTVSDTVKGNGALTYPIGLITADEVQYGGTGNSVKNASQYLYNAQPFWTLFSSSANIDGAFVGLVYLNSGQHNARVTNKLVIRVVVNLTSGVVVSSGNGTTSSPYIILS